MALVNCSITDDVSSVVDINTGGNTIDTLQTWEFHIVPINTDYVVAADAYSINGISYSSNGDSLTFEQDSNGVDFAAGEDDVAPIFKVILSDTVGAYLPDNKVLVQVDFEEGWTMPPNNYDVVFNIDGEARKANLIRVRAVLSAPQLGGLNAFDVAHVEDVVTYEHYTDTDDDKVEDKHYFTSIDLVDPELEFKLATINIEASNLPSSVGEFCLQPVPVLNPMEGEDPDRYIGLLKFAIKNVTETYSASGLITAYSFDLMFTPELDMGNGVVYEGKSIDDHPWSNTYVEDGQFFYEVTSKLNISHQSIRATDEPGATGYIYSITTDAVNEGIDLGIGPFWWQSSDFDATIGDFIADLNSALQISSSGTSNTNIILTTDSTASFDIDLTNSTIGSDQSSMSGFPLSFNLSNNTIPNGVVSGSGSVKTISIPIDIPSTDSEAEYSISVTGTNGTFLQSTTGIGGATPSEGIDNAVTNVMKQYPNPVITVKGVTSLSGGTWGNSSPNGVVINRTGRPLAAADSLLYLPSCNVLSEDFEIVYDLSAGFTGFTTAVTDGYLESYDGGNIDHMNGTFYFDANGVEQNIISVSDIDTMNVVVINNLAVSKVDSDDPVNGKDNLAKVSGTIHYQFYGNADLTIEIDFDQIFLTS